MQHVTTTSSDESAAISEDDDGNNDDDKESNCDTLTITSRDHAASQSDCDVTITEADADCDVPLTVSVDCGISPASAPSSGTWSVRGTAHTAVTWVTGVLSRSLGAPAVDVSSTTAAYDNRADGAISEEPVGDTLLKTADVQQSPDVASASGVASTAPAEGSPFDGGDTLPTPDNTMSSVCCRFQFVFCRAMQAKLCRRQLLP
jgi:hypothetical protein